jgi:hypothetical protein
MGWINDPAEVARIAATLPRPVFRSAAPRLRGSGRNKTTLLYKAWTDVLGAYIPYPAQTIGDCVSQGFGHGTDLLACVQIALKKMPQTFKETATEPLYGMAREVGNFLRPYRRDGSADGAVGAWAAKALSTQGTVSREVVGPYSGERAAQWGGPGGVPAEIKNQARDYKVRTVSLVTSYEELEDALANGYPVPVCSDQGFTMTRDRDGFCQPRGTWMHCMLIVGVRADHRPGACIVQSWGENVPDGPLALDQPNYSFWADRGTVDRMLKQRDSFSLSSFDGYPGQSLPAHWTYAGFA